MGTNYVYIIKMEMVNPDGSSVFIPAVHPDRTPLPEFSQEEGDECLKAADELKKEWRAFKKLPFSERIKVSRHAEFPRSIGICIKHF